MTQQGPVPLSGRITTQMCIADDELPISNLESSQQLQASERGENLDQKNGIFGAVQVDNNSDVIGRHGLSIRKLRRDCDCRRVRSQKLP
jgi:hypothetical protein